jgi:hypothetical protein
MEMAKSLVVSVFTWMKKGDMQAGKFSDTFQILFRYFSETFQILFRDFSETFQRLFRDFSETFQRLFRDFSEFQLFLYLCIGTIIFLAAF